MEVEFREQLEHCKELLEKYPQGMPYLAAPSLYMHGTRVLVLPSYHLDDLVSKAVTSARKALAQLKRWMTSFNNMYI